jgi:hypothetical protein
MPEYKIHLACTVPAYATAWVAATDAKEAIKKARALLRSDEDLPIFKPDWTASDDYRIVLIENAATKKTVYEP